MVEPRWITAPLPSGCEPSSFSSTPGESVGMGHVDDDGDLRITAKVAVCAPAKVVSSWAEPTAITSPRRRQPQRRGARPPRPRMRPGGYPSRARHALAAQLHWGGVDHCHIAHLDGALGIVAILGAISMCSWLSFTGLPRSSASSRCTAFLPTTPGTSPLRVFSTTRWPPGSPDPSRRRGQTTGSPSRRCG